MQPPPSSWAARRTGSSPSTSTARHDTREEASSGTRYAAHPQAPAAGCSACRKPDARRQAPGPPRRRAGNVLPDASPAGEVGVRAARARLRRRLRLLRRRLRAGRPRRRAPGLDRQRQLERRPLDLEARGEDARAPEGRRRLPRARDRLRGRPAQRGRDPGARALHGAPPRRQRRAPGARGPLPEQAPGPEPRVPGRPVVEPGLLDRPAAARHARRSARRTPTRTRSATRSRRPRPR